MDWIELNNIILDDFRWSSQLDHSSKDRSFYEVIHSNEIWKSIIRIENATKYKSLVNNPKCDWIKLILISFLDNICAFLRIEI